MEQHLNFCETFSNVFRNKFKEIEDRINKDGINLIQNEKIYKDIMEKNLKKLRRKLLNCLREVYGSSISWYVLQYLSAYHQKRLVTLSAYAYDGNFCKKLEKWYYKQVENETVAGLFNIALEPPKKERERKTWIAKSFSIKFIDKKEKFRHAKKIQTFKIQAYKQARHLQKCLKKGVNFDKYFQVHAQEYQKFLDIREIKNGFSKFFKKSELEQITDHAIIKLLLFLQVLDPEAKEVYYISAPSKFKSFAPGLLVVVKGRELNELELLSLHHFTSAVSNISVLFESEKKIKYEILKGGTKSAIAALMGRCMSHNIGSHAAYHLEKKEKRKQGSSEHNLRAFFYRYLRERMDFVAAAATQMPIWATTLEIQDLVNGFRENELLLQNIARSERVDKVKIECTRANTEVAIPGGILGAQAFYTILENIIRDGAKYGQAKRRNKNVIKLKIKIFKLSKDKLKTNFVKIIITEDRSNANKIKSIKKALRTIESKGLCNENGGLRPGDWGIKERYIAATFLRGEAAEDILLGDSKSSLPILTVDRFDGKLAWIFYLLKPKELLVVSNNLGQKHVHESNRQRVEVKNWDWLQYSINSSSSSLRYQFVIFCPSKEEHVKQLRENLPYLPYRCLIFSNKDNLTEDLKRKGCLINTLQLKQKSLLFDIQSKWANFLIWRKGLINKLRVIFVNSGTNMEWGNWLLDVVDGGILPIESEKTSSKNGNEDIKIVIDRHPRSDGILNTYFPKINNKRILYDCLYYEPYEKGFSIERIENEIQKCKEINKKRKLILGITEAAIIDILIIDERVDEDIDEMPEEFINAGISIRDMLYAKGITVKGKEYASMKSIPREELLIKWAKPNRRPGLRNNKPYDFVLIHQGIIDKIHNRYIKNKSKSDYAEELIDKIKKGGIWDVIIHSGRGMPELPRQVKFIPLSNIESWITRRASKYDIVQELMAIRKRKE